MKKLLVLIAWALFASLLSCSYSDTGRRDVAERGGNFATETQTHAETVAMQEEIIKRQEAELKQQEKEIEELKRQKYYNQRFDPYRK